MYIVKCFLTVKAKERNSLRIFNMYSFIVEICYLSIINFAKIQRVCWICMIKTVSSLCELHNQYKLLEVVNEVRGRGRVCVCVCVCVCGGGGGVFGLREEPGGGEEGLPKKSQTLTDPCRRQINGVINSENSLTFLMRNDCSMP